MGLCIHYNGIFSENASLPEMIEEVKDIVEALEWESTVFETDFPADSLGKDDYNRNIYGISVVAPQCEPLYLSFLSNGRMSNHVSLKLWGKYENDEESPYLTMLSTKTQYGGKEIHKAIIHLLKYLKGKYFQELEVIDETEYWETGDEDLLEKRFKELSFLLDQVWFGLENIPLNGDESFESYFERLLKIIHKKRK